MEPECIFPPDDQDPADTLGRTDSHSEHLHFLCFFGSQIPRFPDAAAGQTLRSQPDPSPNAPRDEIRRKDPCCDEGHFLGKKRRLRQRTHKLKASKNMGSFSEKKKRLRQRSQPFRASRKVRFRGRIEPVLPVRIEPLNLCNRFGSMGRFDGALPFPVIKFSLAMCFSAWCS